MKAVGRKSILAFGNQWHDTEKEKPEVGVDVVVIYHDRITNALCMAVGWIDNNSRWYSNDDDVNVYGIVAWLEIPEYKPKVENEYESLRTILPRHLR